MMTASINPTLITNSFGTDQVQTHSVQLEANMCITQETAICHNTPIHSFTGDRKKLHWSSTDQHLTMFHFYENIIESKLFCGHNILTENVFVTHV